MDYSIMKEQLNGEYRDAFSAVITYGTLKNYSDEVLTERITELFDTLLTAQTRGKPVNKIVGNNTERFCREFFEDCTSWDMVTRFLESFFIMACITFAITLICVITDTGSVEQSRYNITPCIIGGLIYVIFNAVSNFIIVPLMFKTKKIKPAVWHNISVVLFLVIFITALVLGARKQSRIYIPELTYLICSGAYIAIYFSIRSVIRYRKYGTIRKVHEDTIYSQNTKELMNKKLDIIVMNTWKKQYEQQSAKGKTDPDEFLKKLKRNNHTGRIINIISVIIILMIYGKSVYNVASDTQIFAAIIYAVISGVIIFGVWHFFLKAAKDAVIQQNRLINEWETSGLSFPEFAERFLNKENTDTEIIEDTVTEEQKI